VGIGFAVPSKTAQVIAQELIANGRVIRGWIGATAQNLDSLLASHFKTPSEQGALISDLTPGGPAQEARLKVGDIVTKFGGTRVSTANDLKDRVGKARIGSRVSVELIRDGQLHQSVMTVREQPRVGAMAGQMAGGVPSAGSYPLFGMAVHDVPAELRQLLQGAPSRGALVTSVTPGGPAFEAGVLPGDVIMKANRKEILTAKDFLELVGSLGKAEVAVIYVQRGRKERLFIPLHG
jgi:serine protease Do